MNWFLLLILNFLKNKNKLKRIYAILSKKLKNKNSFTQICTLVENIQSMWFVLCLPEGSCKCEHIQFSQFVSHFCQIKIIETHHSSLKYITNGFNFSMHWWFSLGGCLSCSILWKSIENHLEGKQCSYWLLVA